MDAAYSGARIPFEDRVGCWIMRSLESEKLTFVEDIHEEFLNSFFEAFSQGMRVTIPIELLRGSDPCHLWESAFRAFRESLKQTLKRGSVVGVKKTVDQS